jgi:hypothetical protein
VTIQKIEKVTNIASVLISGAVFVLKEAKILAGKILPGNMILLSGQGILGIHNDSTVFPQETTRWQNRSLLNNPLFL